MPDLPAAVVETARAMSRVLRRGTHDDPERIRRRRDELLSRYGYAARVRESDTGPVLVCYPETWIEDGTLQLENLESTENAVERPLNTSLEEEGWEAIADHNRDVAATVRRRFGKIHGANAEAFGTYMANHHGATVETATAEHVETFLEEYFPRNAWPTEAQQNAVETSIRHLFEIVDEAYPLD